MSDPFGELHESTKEELIERIVAAQEELESLGANKLVEEITSLKALLKDKMISDLDEYVVDEVSNHYAEIQVRSKTIYQPVELEILLGKDRAAYYLEKVVNVDLLNKGIKNGSLSEAALKAGKVIMKEPTTAALYIKKREVEDVGSE